MITSRRLLPILLGCALLISATPAAPSPHGGSPRAAEGPLQHLVGALHEHSGYSDGWFDTRPADYYRSGRDYGLDFMGGADHSDTLGIPISVNEGCLEGDVVPGQNLVTGCLVADDDNPADSFTKWEATKRQATEESTPAYTAFTGFEWTNDRFDHMNVYFSDNNVNAKIDGSHLSMEAFWEWFTRSPALGGGSDGLGTFNHPGTKSLNKIIGIPIQNDDTRNWNDFAFRPEADDRMVGIEVFRDRGEYGTRTNTLALGGFYAHALDRGWHVGPIGAEDLGHEYDDAYGDDDNNWGGPELAKTVILAEENTPEALRAAMLERRFYAIGRNENDLRLDFTADGAVMGSRVARPDGSTIQLTGHVNNPTGLTLELITTGGQKIASAAGTDLQFSAPVTGDETWYHLRVRRGNDVVAYSAPVWINATRPAVQGEWLAGDLHVHTCYSHDGYCGPDDDNSTELEYEFDPEHPEDTDISSDVYTLSGDVDERFTEASIRGLDYLAITDHNDVRSSSDPGFGSHGVIGVAGYENSLSGHAQMIGARRIYDRGSGAAGVNAMADALRADGGVFQINHPFDDLAVPLEGCDEADMTGLDWRYGMQVVPDTIEVWNIGHFLQPPLPAGNSNDDSELFWECFLDAGHHIGATGGSDSHWITLSLVQGVGNPSTWVLAGERTEAGVLEALREGRTSITAFPPVQGGGPLMLEADSDGDGVFESVVGDSMRPGSLMRVRSASPLATGNLIVRANSETILDTTMVGGGAVTFPGPDHGWVRAKLVDVAMPDGIAALCDPLDGTEADTSYCDNQLQLYGLTSPIYVAAEPTSLVLSAPATAHATDAATVCGTLTAASGPVSGRDVRLVVAGDVTTATTNAGGVACVTQVLDVDAGTITAAATFAGDPQYGPSAATDTIEVIREPTTIRITDTSWTGHTARIDLVLEEHDGVPLGGHDVLVTVGAAMVSAQTDALGHASVILDIRGGGRELPVTAAFAATARHDASSVQSSIRRGN